ncbi:MAG: sulfatase-like hydrolase/transferase, partial [Verrucomicrobiota bacterium]
HYKNRKKGQPFFAVFNLAETHESGIFRAAERNSEEFRVKAEDLSIPPYQLATPETIKDWQFFYERLELMDKHVGRILNELESLGEGEDTIILYCSDHGGITLRTKRYLHDTGTRIPLIAYFPKKWQHLAPESPGSVSNRLVQFIDMPKTWLNLAGIQAADSMTGRAFLGMEIDPEPETVFLFSGRFDETPDNSRGVTDGRWKYIRNFESDRKRFQMMNYPLRHDGQRSQAKAYAKGALNVYQSTHYIAQPPEELYDTRNDPHEINNLVNENPVMLEKMRLNLHEHMIYAHDLGFIPEPLKQRINRQGRQTIYEYGQSDANYPIARVLELATRVSDNEPEYLDTFIDALNDENPTIRYWGAVGIRILGEEALSAKAEIHDALTDPEFSVRIAAAIALGNMGDVSQASTKLFQELENATNDIEATWALDGFKLLDTPSVIEGLSEAQIKSLARGKLSKSIIEMLRAGGSSVRMPSVKL